MYVCDDEALMLEQLAAQLACFGYEAVALAQDLVEGWRAAHSATTTRLRPPRLAWYSALSAASRSSS